MKLTITALTLLLASPAAFADGFICESARDALSLQVYNKVSPTGGAPTAAQLIVSEVSGAGNKMIARFTDSNQTLRNHGAIYLARVDHRYADSNRKEERIAGTTIGALSHFNLDLDFSFDRPVADGAFVRAKLNLFQRNGAEISLDLGCTRFLR